MRHDIMQMLKLVLLSPFAIAAEPACEAHDRSSCNASTTKGSWSKHGEIYEYVSNANPAMAEIPIRVFGPELHSSGPSKVTPLDMKEALEVEYPATVPNLLANFVRITVNDTAETSVDYGATSQAFYVMRGSGTTTSREAAVHWAAGDLFTLPHL